MFPVSVLYCYYISSPDFIPVSLSSLPHLSASYRSIPSFICGPPSVPLCCPRCLLWFSASSVYSEMQKPGEIITLTQSRVSLQIMTSDLCLYHVFSGTLLGSIAGTGAQCSTTLPSSDGFIHWCLPKRAQADDVQCLCSMPVYVVTKCHGCLDVCL